MHNGRSLPLCLIGRDEHGRQMSRCRTLLLKLTFPSLLAQPIDSRDRLPCGLMPGGK
jgi:hypothetical protein